MYLGNPLLPINLTAQGAADTIKKKLEEKFWHEYELKTLKLDLVPYFLFNYHYYVEDGGDDKKTIKSAVHGLLAVDGHNIVIREDLVELLKNNWKKSSPDIPRGEFYEKWNNIEKREQDEVLQMKTAEYFEVPKQNVVISSPKKMFVPFYKATVRLEGKDYSFIINAIDGSMQGFDVISPREKGYREIARETINELKSPSAWIKYSKDAIFEGTDAISSKMSKTGSNNKSAKSSSVDLSFLDSKLVLILIMLLGLLLIFMGIFRIKPF